MPTEISGKLADLHVTFAYCEGVLSVKSERSITYGGKPEMRTYEVYVRFLTNNDTAIDVIRKSSGEIKLKGYFGNDGKELIFEVQSAEEL